MARKEMSEETQRVLSALSYPIWLVALITAIITKRKENYAKYHSYQGLLFNCAWLLAYLISIVIIQILDTMPFVGDTLASIFGIIFGMGGIAIFVISILLAVKAYQNEKFRIPVIYDILPMSVK